MEKIERFKLKVELDPETGCAVWTAARDSRGYSRFDTKRAARWLYEYKNGPIPEGLEISHVCHNPACVRPHPEHVIIETHAANMARSAKLGVWDGVRNSQSKLTEIEVIEIRTLYQLSSLSLKRLAELFKVSLRTIYNVISYETYFDLVPDLWEGGGIKNENG